AGQRAAPIVRDAIAAHRAALVPAAAPA
ncbi:formate dehydrogenase, partial [Burkholderia cenocepacia]|nr:formate dehydrogenase [Burkholderia cenocepacia]